MTRLFEHPATFIPRRSGCAELSAQEQATILAAREILARRINRNPSRRQRASADTTRKKIGYLP